MSRDKETLITLTIANSQLELHVIRFKGHEALNQPYRFDIDLISPTPTLDYKALISRSAFLSFGALDEGMDDGIHGLIGSASQRHAGAGLTHYRVSLEPRLQALQQRSHRRIFQGLSAPQIIVQLLEEHGIDDDSYRFEQTVGLYPPRPTCAQYDESDLHLLQRLCEEEGIHYRFEHNRTGHLLIFADDPASFPEQPRSTRFYRQDGRATPSPTISHMAEHFSTRPSYSSHGGFPFDQQSMAAQDHIGRAPARNPAANQSSEAFRRFDQQSPEEARIRQLSERSLELLRCERRQVQGYSNQPTLVSGQILQVLAHPDNLFNDQWLLTEIHHAGKQPQLLDGFDPLDIAAIFDHDPPHRGKGWPTPDHHPGFMPGAEIAPFSRGYRNHFRAIPWAMPFRPPLTHGKPQIHGYQTATLMGIDDQPVQRDKQGRVQVKLHWQQAQGSASVSSWLPLAIQGTGDVTPNALRAGTQVLVSYFDNDPDRPVVCGYLINLAESQVQRPRIRIDGLPLDPVAEHIHLSAGQTLHADARHGLTLNTLQSRIELQSESIQITLPQSLPGAPNRTDGPRQPIPERASCGEDQPLYAQPPQQRRTLSRTSKPGEAEPSQSPPADLSALFQWLNRSQPDGQ